MEHRLDPHHPSASGTGDDLPLRTPAAVHALLELLDDHAQVHELATHFPTWAKLAAAPKADLGHHVGLRGAQITVPKERPAAPTLPAGVRLVTRYDPTYPGGARDLAVPPAALYVAGSIPEVPLLGVGGAENPTITGVEIAKAAALTATLAGVPVVVAVTTGCAMNALRTALDAGGTIVAVLPHGFAVTSNHQMLLEQVLEAGGAVVTSTRPGLGLAQQRVDAANQIVAGLAAAVVLAEVGAHPAAGKALATAAVHAGRSLIVPVPDAPAQSGRYIAPSAFGSAVFASAKEWSPEYFGSNSRIESRCANGLSPADHVVADPQELATAVAVACRLTDHTATPA